MNFTKTPLSGAFLVDLEPASDDRGFFARTFCEDEFAKRGLPRRFVQCNISFNAKRGTLRGMHFQAAPHAESKLVRCTSGAIFDVIVDIRRSSATYCSWYGIELTSANRRSLFIPDGYAHGFLSLEDNSEVSYMMSTAYAPDFARGFRWDDAAVGIRWPAKPAIISERDATYPVLEDSHGGW